jgi:hypothetical protein
LNRQVPLPHLLLLLLMGLMQLHLLQQEHLHCQTAVFVAVAATVPALVVAAAVAAAAASC